MNKAWFLILTQWTVVLLYAKFGYYATGDNAEHWARFFSVSNQLILCGWIFYLWKYKVSIKAIKTGLTFNFALAILWSQHYIKPLNYFIEVEKNGIFMPVLGYIVICLFVTFITDKDKS